MLQQKPEVFSNALTVMIDSSVQSHRPRYQSLFVITPKMHPPSLNPFHLILSSHICSTPSLFVTQSQNHTSLSSLHGSTSLFSFPAPFKTLSLVSTFPTDCALTLQKSKGVLSVLIIHVWWEAPASLHCKPRKKASAVMCVSMYLLYLFVLVCLFLLKAYIWIYNLGLIFIGLAIIPINKFNNVVTKSVLGM